MTAKTNLSTDQLIASLDKEALREVLVTLVTFFEYDVPERKLQDALFYLEGDYDKLKEVLVKDERVMSEANSLACDLDRD